MNKWLLLLLGVVTIALVYVAARQCEYTPPWAMPKYGEVSRGDITVPISASGLIHANQVIEVKPEASGSIDEITVVEGDYVKKDAVLLRLDPQDEQRAVDRAKADLDRTQAILVQSNVAVERAQQSIENAKQHVDELEAQAEYTEFDVREIEENYKKGIITDLQLRDAHMRQRMLKAQVAAAKIAVRQAELQLDDSKAAVISQQALVESTQKTWEDAIKRLNDTTILAPADGIVTNVYVKQGMLVQSGTSSLTGGTALLNLADVSEKKVIARLDEADYGRVLAISPLMALPEMPGLRQAAEADMTQLSDRTGDVTITVDAFPEDKFTGRIERVEPQGKLNAGSSVIQFDVHVVITDEQRHKLPLGAQAQVEFTVERANDALRVPADAVKSQGGQRGVFIKVPPPKGQLFGREFVPCRFGISDGEFTEILEVLDDAKLEPGTQVYTKLPQDAEDGE